MVDVCDVPLISNVCDAAGDAAGALVSAPFEWLAQGLGNAAKWMFEAVWKVFDSTTMVDVTSGEFTKVYNILFGVAAFVMVGFFMLQVIGGMIRREPAAFSRAALGLAKSILGSFVALTLVAAALAITDQLCIGIVSAAGTNLSDMGDRIGLLAAGLVGLNITAPGAGAVLTIFIASMAIGAAGIVWISLLVRKALLLIAIVFAPIALSGSSWDHTRGWVSKWASFVLALILSKVVLVVIFLLATAQVSAPIDSDLQSVSDPIAGVVLMLMAGFAPYLTYKAINFMGFDMYHSMSTEQEAKSALNRPVPIPLSNRTGAGPSKILDGGTSGTAAGSSGSSAPTPPAPPKGSSGATGGGAGASAGSRSGGGATAGGGAAAAGASGAAAGGAVVGVAVAKEAASAGIRTGSPVGGAGAQQADAADQTQSTAPRAPRPLHVTDPVPGRSTPSKV